MGTPKWTRGVRSAGEFTPIPKPDIYHMTMFMYIMTMNIYITPENEKRLRQEKSMSGLINDLLVSHYAESKKYIVEEAREPSKEKASNTKTNEDGTISINDPDKPAWTGPLMRNQKKGKL